MSEDTTENVGTIRRRNLLGALGAAAALAGCGSSGDGGSGGDDGSDGSSDQELGERVPTVRIEYWANTGDITSRQEEMLSLMRPHWEELGLSIELVPKDIGSSAANIYGDERDSHAAFWQQAQSPERNDPDLLTIRFAADHAGPGGDNLVHMVNCDYTHPAHAQAHEMDPEARQSLVNEAISTASEEYYMIPTIAEPWGSAVLTDYVDVDGVGEQGIIQYNPAFHTKSTPLQNDYLRLTISPITIETTNFPTLTGGGNFAYWSKLVHSPLVLDNENYELEPVIASNYSIEDDGHAIEFELRDTTFHNGDPVTAEDVEFTFQQIARGGEAGAYPNAETPTSWDSIDVIDEKTVVFNFETPYAPALRRSFQQWGILHKETWENGGAPENPAEFEFDPIIGSGPFEVTELRPSEFWTLEAHDGHGYYDHDHGIQYQAVREVQTEERAFINEEVDIIFASTTQANRLQEELGDQMEHVSVATYTSMQLLPQHPIAPTKFSEFRHAMGNAFDRAELNEIVASGGGTPVVAASELFPGIHPWAPPEDELAQFTDADVEAARNVLADAGWGWDDSDNLHYPPDADLSPVYPQGEQPTDFPCLDDDGEYVPPE